MHATVAAVLERLGRIDALVNNAGISWGAPADTMPVEKWSDVLATNATGCFLMSQAAGREMIRAGGGSIINIASVSGLIGTAPRSSMPSAMPPAKARSSASRAIWR